MKTNYLITKNKRFLVDSHMNDSYYANIDFWILNHYDFVPRCFRYISSDSLIIEDSVFIPHESIFGVSIQNKRFAKMFRPLGEWRPVCEEDQ